MAEVRRWICYRRIAGGLNKGQQQQIAAELLPGLGTRVRNSAEAYVLSEKLRCLAALELLDHNVKRKLGEPILKRIEHGQARDIDYWALGRIGARHLLHGSPAHVLPAPICQEWLERLLRLKTPSQQKMLFVYEQLARKTSERHLNVSQSIAERIIGVCPDERLAKLLTDVVALDRREEEQAYGETLPTGLVLS